MLYKEFQKLTVLFICVVISIHPSLFSQSIHKVQALKYEYLGQEYKYQEMGDIFAQNEEANHYFIKANKKLKTSNTWGHVSLGSLGLGLLAIAAEGDCDFVFGSDPCTIGIFGAIAVVLVFPISGFTGLSIRSSSNRNRRKSVDVFNEAYGYQLPKDHPIELHLVAKNGIGIQLIF